MQYHFVPKSGNAKTGPIPVTTTDRTSCPSACPFKGNGCYADGGHVRLHWDRLTRGERGHDERAQLAHLATIETGALWRDNQAGDQAGTRDNRLDGRALERKRKAAAHTRGFTYTHYPMLASECDAKTAAHNRAVLAKHNSKPGLTVNVSANTLDHADELSALAIAPVVAVVPMDHPKKGKTPAGRDVRVCPATYKDDVTCASCGICESRDPRRPIIAFPAHGAFKRKAESIAKGA